MERVKPGVVAVEGKRGEPAPPTSTLSSSSISMSFYSSSLFEERALLGYKISPPDLSSSESLQHAYIPSMPMPGWARRPSTEIHARYFIALHQMHLARRE